MKFLATLCLILMAGVCFADDSDKAERIQANTVVLTDGQGHGSGVLFSRDGETFIWTAAHVAEIWENSDGTFEPISVVQGDLKGTAEVLRSGDYEAGVDVALLRVTEGDFEGDAEFYRGFDEVRVGQKVIHCGSPYDRDWNQRLVAFGRFAFVDRLVDGFPILAPRRIDQIDITAYPGCSGGPVVDEETEGIVGLLVMGSAPRLTIIEPTRHIYKWAKEHDCLWAFDREARMPRSMPAWPSDQFLRKLRERQADPDWGELPPEPEPEQVDSIIDIIQREVDEIKEILDSMLPEQPTDPCQPVLPNDEPCDGPCPTPAEPLPDEDDDPIIIEIIDPNTEYDFLPIYVC
jgi:hypothetical protein